MTSDVNICNRALQAIGTRSQIASLTESSVEARNCNMIYEDTRDEILGMAFWNFARATAYLSLLKSAPGTPSNPTASSLLWSTAYPSPPWLYEYQYPGDCLQVRQIIQQLQDYYVGVPLTTAGSPTYPYAIGTGARFIVATDLDSTGQQQNVILTNQYQAIGIYTRRITDPNLFGANFVEALVSALAAKLAIPLTGQVALASAMYAKANATIVAARATDGNEGLTIIDNMPDWITARGDYEGYADFGYSAPYGSLYGIF